MLNILITGFRGRMGQAVATAVSECEETRVAAGIDLGDSLEEALKRCDLVIDFTLPSFTNELIEGCVESGIPLVMGTTGHDDKQLDLILTASKSIPIVHAPNYSVGVILTEARGLSYDKDCRHGRFGDVGARTDTEVGVHALRGGDVVGDHPVIYAGNGERIELTHKASSRLTFANGAVRAARWIESEGHKSGLFDMQDVLGLK